ncbi:hypothetical protein SUNI508_04279 [Seiridium unicorne]|uniref:Uncharacterized protein n=1 Tax=Seiridium unicorne TaxID=138068 RepID=A0ABR2V8Y5_9PEZI
MSDPTETNTDWRSCTTEDSISPCSGNDIIVIVHSRDDFKLFRVCVHCLTRWSRGWSYNDVFLPGTLLPIRKMVFSYSDSIQAMGLVLRMIHGVLEEIPTELSPIKLFEIAKIVKKYELECSFGRSQQRWFAQLRVPETFKYTTEERKPLTDGEFTRLLEFVWTAWVFGERDVFQYNARKLLLNWSPSRHRRLNFHGMEQDLDIMQTVFPVLREEAVIGMVKVFTRQLRRRRNDGVHLCQQGGEYFSPQCDEHIFKTISDSLGSMGIHDHNTLRDLDEESILSLAQKLLSIRLTRAPGLDGSRSRFWPGHFTCIDMSMMRRFIEGWTTEIRLPLGENLEAHFRDLSSRPAIDTPHGSDRLPNDPIQRIDVDRTSDLRHYSRTGASVFRELN